MLVSQFSLACSAVEIAAVAGTVVEALPSRVVAADVVVVTVKACAGAKD